MPEPRKKHGNRAKIDPESQIASLYATNRVTLSDHKEHETPVVSDDDVAYARRFAEENKK
jgi:hypothetical protein